MNITFLIGNGFDLNIGMKTSYRDFYQYYINSSKKETHPLIQSLKDSLVADIDNWADFELQFGDYCNCFQTYEDFEVVFDDVSFKLANYIESEQNRYNFDIDIDNKVFLYKDFASPELYLSNADKKALEGYKSKWNNYSEWKIDVISFNFSTSLDSLLAQSNKKERISIRGVERPVVFNGIKHIHGYTTENMVLGVNDPSQINNDYLKSNPYFLNALVKPECNKAMKHLIDQDCKDVLNYSNLICLFGLSIGDTDKIWWEIIGKCLFNNNTSLIIFSRGDEIPAIRRYKMKMKEDSIKDIFLSKTNLTSEQKEYVSANIYVGYNTQIFDIKLAEKSVV